MGVLHSLPAHLLITSPHTLHLAITQLQHGCCIHQLQSLLGNSSHHLHSLQLTSVRRHPLQQDFLGCRSQFKGTLPMSPRGDIINQRVSTRTSRGSPPSRSFPRYTCTAPVYGNPTREITEPDWTVLRRVHPLALERFCERVLAEIDRVSRDGAKSRHARYLQIFRIIKDRDREIAGLLDNPKRSHALTMLAQIHSQGLLTEDEFSQFGPRNARCHPNGARRRMKTLARERGNMAKLPACAGRHVVGLAPVFQHDS